METLLRSIPPNRKCLPNSGGSTILNAIFTVSGIEEIAVFKKKEPKHQYTTCRRTSLIFL
jgi:hypothetical protein